MSEQVLHKGSCHCGAIQLTILAPRDIDICECNCSICSMKGFLGLEIPASQLKSLDGKGNLSEYRFNTGTAKHWFCKTCGICPLYVPRSFPQGYCVNWRCLDRDGFRSHRVVPADGRNWEAMHAGK